MNLDHLLNYVLAEKNLFETKVRNKARSLRLKSVAEKISLENCTPRFNQTITKDDLERVRQYFRDGKPLTFLLLPGHYTVILDRQALVLQGYAITIKTFNGKNVSSLYETIASDILEREEDSCSIPF